MWKLFSSDRRQMINKQSALYNIVEDGKDYGKK